MHALHNRSDRRDSSILKSFNEQGFHVARGLLDDAVTGQVLEDFDLALKQKLAQLGLPIRNGGDNLALRDNMAALLDYDKTLYLRLLRLASRLHSVAALATHRRIIAILRQLGMNTLSLTAGFAAHIVSNELRIPGGYLGWAPHQDWTAGQGSLRQVVVWAPLMDVDADFYPLKLIPGSHKSGVWQADREKVISRGALIEIDADRYADEDWMPVEMARGDVAFMSGFLVHTTGEGRRSGVRIACGVRYEDITEPTYVDRGYPCAFNGQTATQKELHPGFPTPAQVAAIYEE